MLEHLDVSTMTAVVVAILLGFEAFQRRVAARARPTIICPNKVEALPESLEEIAADAAKAAELIAEVRSFLHERDQSGALRIHNRELTRQAIEGIDSLEARMIAAQNELVLIRDRMERNGWNSKPNG